MNEFHTARFQPGQKIDQYILKEEIASGGMGQVFLAFQESMNRLVAIKFLPEVDKDNSDTVARFEREVYMISHLEHPHIVPVYGFGEVFGNPYIVMRHMNGGTLRDHFQSGKLTLKKMLAVVDQLVTAIDYAHQQGIIHRDIKPSNIFLDERENAYLADFGLAKTVSGSYDLTRTDEGISGTPEYMSPEQVRGLKLDGRTDIYSLGVIVFQLLSGHPPFSGQNPMDTVLKQISDPVPSILGYQPDLPADLDRIFSKVLSKEYTDRYETGRMFAADLNKALADLDPNWVPFQSSGKVDAPATTEEAVEPQTDEETKKRLRKIPTKEEMEQQANDQTQEVIDLPTQTWFTQRNRRILLFSTLGILLLLGLAYLAYLFYRQITNPIPQLEPVAVSISETPKDIELDDLGQVWVINHDTNELFLLRTDCSADQIDCGSILARVPVGSRPQFLVPAGNEVLVGRQLTQGLVAVSLDSANVRTLDFPYIPVDAVRVDDSIWISTGQNLIEIDLQGNELSNYDAGLIVGMPDGSPNSAGALYHAGSAIWVAMEGSGDLLKFDLATRTFEVTVNLSTVTSQLISITGTDESQRLWVTLNRDNQLYQLDSVTGEEIGSIATSDLPLDVAVHEDFVYVVARGDSLINVFDAAEGSFIGSLDKIVSPTTLTVEPCGTDCAYLWVGSESTGLIHRVDISSIE